MSEATKSHQGSSSDIGGIEIRACSLDDPCLNGSRVKVFHEQNRHKFQSRGPVVARQSFIRISGTAFSSWGTLRCGGLSRRSAAHSAHHERNGNGSLRVWLD